MVYPRTLDHIHVASLPLNFSTKDYLWELFLVFSGHGLVVVWLQAAVNEGKEVWHIWSIRRRDLWPKDVVQVKESPLWLHELEEGLLRSGGVPDEFLECLFGQGLGCGDGRQARVASKDILKDGAGPFVDIMVLES